MQNVRHESLESHVFDTSNVLGPLEVVRRAISSAFTGVVDHCPSISTPDLHAGCCSSGRDGRGIRPYNTADMVRSTSLTGKVISKLTLVTSPKARPSFLK